MIPAIHLSTIPWMTEMIFWKPTPGFHVKFKIYDPSEDVY